MSATIDRDSIYITEWWNDPDNSIKEWTDEQWNAAKQWATEEGRKYNKYISDYAYQEYERIKQKTEPNFRFDRDDNGYIVMGSESRNSEIDAFRHAYSSAWATYTGGLIGQIAGDAVEWANSENMPLEARMDFWNNAIGNEIVERLLDSWGMEFEEKNLTDKIRDGLEEALRNGYLISDPNEDILKTIFLRDSLIQILIMTLP